MCKNCLLLWYESEKASIAAVEARANGDHSLDEQEKAAYRTYMDALLQCYNLMPNGREVTDLENEGEYPYDVSR